MADIDIIANFRVQSDTAAIERAQQNLQKYDQLLQTSGAKSAESFRLTLSGVEKLRLKEQELYRQRDDQANAAPEKQRKIADSIDRVNAAINRQMSTSWRASQLEKANTEKMLADKQRAAEKMTQIEKNNADRLAVIRARTLSSIERETQRRVEIEKKAADKIAAQQQKESQQQTGGGIFSSMAAQFTAANLITGAIQKTAAAAKQLVVDIFEATKETEKLQSDLLFFLRGRGLSENAITATISEIKTFAAENPVADLKTTTEGFLGLLNASTKIGVNQALELNKSLVDITAGNIEQQKGLVNVIGQVARQNKIVGNDWFQFSNNGLNLIETLKTLDKFAKLTDLQVKELATKGKIGFDDLSQAIRASTAEGGKYFGRSEQAAKTLNGQLAALKDAVFNFEAALGKGASGGLTDFIAKIVQLINKSREFIEGNEFQEYSGRLSVAIENVLLPLNDLSTWFVTNSGDGSPLSKYIDFAVSEWELYGKVISGTTKIIENGIKAFSDRNEYAKYLREQGSTRSFLGVENPLIGMRKDTAGTLSEAEFIAQKQRKEQDAANLSRQNEIAQLKEIAALRDAALAKDAAKGTFTQNIGQAKALISGNAITLDTVRKFNSELTKEEVAHLNALLGKYEDAAQKEEISRDKEADKKLQKQRDFHAKFLQKEIEFNENLSKIIAENNDKLAEIREKDSPNSVPKIIAANERAKQAELRAVAERAKEIDKAQKEVQKELGKVPGDLLAQFAAARAKIKTIEGQVNEKFALLEMQSVKEFQKKENDEKLKSFNDFLKKRVEYFKQSEKQLLELSIDTERKRLEGTGDKSGLLSLDNKQRIQGIQDTFAAAKEVNAAAYRDNLVSEEIYLNRKLQLNQLEQKQYLLNEDKFQKELKEYRAHIFDEQIKKETENIQTRADILAAQLAAETDYAVANILGGKGSGAKKQSEIDKVERAAKLRGLQDENNTLRQRKENLIANNATQKELEEITAAIAKNTRQIAESQQEGENAAQKVTESYISGVGEGLNSVFSIIGTIETALTESIDRQIALQEKRVEDAREMAKKGSADALQIEEERLNELQRKRERYAKAQIALNTAQRVSAQLLSIAQVVAGQSVTGPLAPITIPLAIASVLASLGAGFIEAQALEKGTLSVQPKNGVGGRKTDDIPAMLNKGEAVIPTDRAKDYRNVLASVYERKYTPKQFDEMLGNFGKIPVPNFSSATISGNGNNNATAKLYAKIAELTEKIDKLQSKVAINLDMNGLNIAYNNATLTRDSMINNL